MMPSPALPPPSPACCDSEITSVKRGISPYWPQGSWTMCLPSLSFCYEVNYEHHAGVHSFITSLGPENLGVNLLPITLTGATNVIGRVYRRQSQFLPLVLSPSKHPDLDNKLCGPPVQNTPQLTHFTYSLPSLETTIPVDTSPFMPRAIKLPELWL